MGLFLFIGGTALAAAGLAGILYCIAVALRCRSARLEDSEMRSKLEKLVRINLISFMLAVFGGICAAAGLMT